MILLAYQTPREWVDAVRADFDSFLQDHAANERKASAAAIQMAVQHHDIPPLVDALVELAGEEMDHFRQVYEILRERDTGLGQDSPDPYMTKLHGAIRKQAKSDFLLDRLLVFSIVEARGCERFGMLADALEEGPLKTFYTDLTRAEARHRGLFTRLARDIFDPTTVAKRIETLVEIEAKIIAALPLQATLH